MAVHISTPTEYESLVNKYDTGMFDCDGVLWHGDRLIDGAVQVLDTLRKRGRSHIE
jgi:4-nitrophenyl phosphatase